MNKFFRTTRNIVLGASALIEIGCAQNNVNQPAAEPVPTIQPCKDEYNYGEKENKAEIATAIKNAIPSLNKVEVFQIDGKGPIIVQTGPCQFSSFAETNTSIIIKALEAQIQQQNTGH